MQTTNILKHYTYTVILQVVLYDSETRSLILRKERRLKVFENRILRRIFRPNSDDDEECIRLRNEALRSLYRSTKIFGLIKSR